MKCTQTVFTRLWLSSQFQHIQRVSSCCNCEQSSSSLPISHAWICTSAKTYFKHQKLIITSHWTSNSQTHHWYLIRKVSSWNHKTTVASTLHDRKFQFQIKNYWIFWLISSSNDVDGDEKSKRHANLFFYGFYYFNFPQYDSSSHNATVHMIYRPTIVGERNGAKCLLKYRDNEES